MLGWFWWPFLGVALVGPSWWSLRPTRREQRWPRPAKRNCLIWKKQQQQQQQQQNQEKSRRNNNEHRRHTPLIIRLSVAMTPSPSGEVDWKRNGNGPEGADPLPVDGSDHPPLNRRFVFVSFLFVFCFFYGRGWSKNENNTAGRRRMKRGNRRCVESNQTASSHKTKRAGKYPISKNRAWRQEINVYRQGENFFLLFSQLTIPRLLLYLVWARGVVSYSLQILKIDQWSLKLRYSIILTMDNEKIF